MKMLDRLFAGGSLPALEAMLAFASERQRVIATNIANVDTLGYRTRDLSEGEFRRALDGAFGGRGLPARVEAQEADDGGTLKPGGNNVDLEVEMAKMLRNSVLHSTASTLLAHQFSLLREAVSGHVIA
jgi:flagellar basal-body rod protein FlgB